MIEVTVRPAVAAEHQTLEALQRRASLENEGDRDALLANPSTNKFPIRQIVEGRVFVAERNGEILGFYAVLPREDGSRELDALFVNPGRWRQGVGRALVAHCSTSAQRAGARYLYVVGNPHAMSFYSACGFEAVGTERTQFDIGLVMKRAL
jgi:N-acetylglutamate synthase-like GNAT family acetyltransferase